MSTLLQDIVSTDDANRPAAGLQRAHLSPTTDHDVRIHNNKRGTWHVARVAHGIAIFHMQ